MKPPRPQTGELASRRQTEHKNSRLRHGLAASGRLYVGDELRLATLRLSRSHSSKTCKRVFFFEFSSILCVHVMMTRVHLKGREIRWPESGRVVVWRHLVCIARRRVAFRRRQPEAALGEDKERPFPDTFVCATRVSRFAQANDRSRPG